MSLNFKKRQGNNQTDKNISNMHNFNTKLKSSNKDIFNLISNNAPNQSEAIIDS